MSLSEVSDCLSINLELDLELLFIYVLEFTHVFIKQFLLTIYWAPMMYQAGRVLGPRNQKII